jgi:hypothetical protein
MKERAKIDYRDLQAVDKRKVERNPPSTRDTVFYTAMHCHLPYADWMIWLGYMMGRNSFLLCIHSVLYIWINARTMNQECR